jgi:hypothetical protein
MINRRLFLSVALAGAATPRLGGLLGSPARQTSHAAFPRQDPELVLGVVTQAHRSLEEVERLVEQAPELAKAAWDWGFGDWETPLGAASHMGHREMAEYLIRRGARPTLFSAAMLGQVDVIRAWVGANSGVQSQPGPHGITLLAHARAGGEPAQPVVDYLTEVGRADPALEPEPGPSEIEGLTGTYRYGPGQDEVLAVELGSRGLSIRRPGSARRGLVDRGGRVFHPAGAPSVRIDLSRPGRLVMDFSGARFEGRLEPGG